MNALSMSAISADLSNPDWWTRISTEVALRHAGAAALDGLIALLDDSAQPNDARWRAAHALGMIGEKRALPHLIAALRDPSSDVQYFAAWALGKIGDGQSFTALADVLNSPTIEEQANFAAAMSLAQIDRRRGLDVLRAALDGDNDAARRVAMGALATLEASW
jgi:HEAT repeat protein